MRRSYVTESSCFRYLRNKMALPLLPAEHMEAAFRRLSSAVTEPQLFEFNSYISSTWPKNRIWSVDEI